MFGDEIFEIENSMDLHVMNSPESEYDILAVGPVCACDLVFDGFTCFETSWTVATKATVFNSQFCVP